MLLILIEYFIHLYSVAAVIYFVSLLLLDAFCASSTAEFCTVRTFAYNQKTRYSYLNIKLFWIFKYICATFQEFKCNWIL